MYGIICRFVSGTATTGSIAAYCLVALAAYAVKILCFPLSTGTSHSMAYNILEGLRLRLVDRFARAPLGSVEAHSIGEIKTMMVDKIENLEPPLAHMIPEGAGHIVLPIVSIAALAVMLSMSMVGSLAKLEVFSENMRQVKCTVDSLEEFLDMPELPEPAARAEVKGSEVVLGDVRFSYTGNAADEVLHGIDLRLPEGSITVGGVNVKDMPLAQLSEYVNFVTQDNYLFRCSLLENIRLGKSDATDDEVKAAARAAQCEEFISKQPQGYDTVIGEGGGTLSGGERQHISIARAILKDSPIIILDEATASIDPEN